MPCVSFTASGSLGKAITFSRWKGQYYARELVIPKNPKTAGQVNVRTALTLLNAYWQTLSDPYHVIWDEFAAGSGMSGWNAFCQRGMKQYVIQLTTAVLPTSVSILGDPPADVWTWA